MSRHIVEHRQAPRMTVNSWGKVLHISARLRISNIVPCRVIDVSVGGAQLEMDSVLFDDCFYLEMDCEPNKLTNCRVVRRRGNRIGVVFIM